MKTASALAASGATTLPGLLFAMRFDETGLGHAIEPDGEDLRTDAFGEGFLWLHFDLAASGLEPMVADGRFGPTGLAASIFNEDHHQRVLVEGSHIGAVVADLGRRGSRNPDEDPTARLHFVIGPRFLVSGRRQPVESPEATRDAAREGMRIASPILLLETLIGQVIASIAEIGARLTDELDDIEDHILDERVRGDRRRLGPIRRDAVRLHRQLLGLRAVFHRMEGGIEGCDLPPNAVAAAARLAQRLDALDRDMTLAAERSRLMQEELSARVADQSNRQLYTLSILSALLLPPTLVTGLFGINTKGLPLADFENGSTIVILIAVISAALAFGLIRVLGIRRPTE